jgi:small subunit ribosomal protein S21
MLIIDVKDGNIERALKSYKNKVKSVKQIEQLRNRKEFEKPSVTKRIAKQKAIRKEKLQNFFDKNNTFL